MLIAVLYKDERAAPRRQNAVRQCFRPCRGQTGLLRCIAVKCAIKRSIKAACQIVCAACAVRMNRHGRAAGKVVLGVDAERRCRVGIL